MIGFRVRSLEALRRSWEPVVGATHASPAGEACLAPTTDKTGSFVKMHPVAQSVSLYKRMQWNFGFDSDRKSLICGSSAKSRFLTG
jgi:hypothetical protein